jgi:hypothetical protein
MAVRIVAVTALLLAVAAAPAQAAAALDSLEPCYVSTGPETEKREKVTVSGTDFLPNTAVEVLIDGAPVFSALTDAVGDFAVRVDAPYQSRGERPFTLEVQDGANRLAAQSRVTNLAVSVRPRQAPPSSRVRFRGRGFMQTGPVYAHYLYGRKLQLEKTVRLAAGSSSPCGTFSVKRRQIPVENARTGNWTIQIDQKKAYDPQPDPVWVRLPIKVSESFGRI